MSEVAVKKDDLEHRLRMNAWRISKESPGCMCERTCEDCVRRAREFMASVFPFDGQFYDRTDG